MGWGTPPRKFRFTGLASNNPRVVIGAAVRGSDDHGFTDDLIGTLVDFASLLPPKHIP
jgi:hypothetical protein